MFLGSMELYALKLSANWELDALGKHGKVRTEVFNKLGPGCFGEVLKGGC